MQYHWLSRKFNKNLIVFFAGWSFDEKPFQFLDFSNYDVVIFYDYNNLDCDYDFKVFDNYENKYLITWSMGVYAAYKLKDCFKNFTKKVAVNGTVYPVDNIYGIPEKTFLLTLKHAEKGLESRFYMNIFDNINDYNRYLKTPVIRTIENRVKELENLYSLIKNDDIEYEKFYDFAYISSNDKIIPAKNQAKFWSDYQTNYKLLECGHFPYYNFKRWNDLLC